MKHFLLGTALVASLVASRPVHAQDTAKDKQAYSARVQSIFRGNLPVMGQFANLLKTEAGLQQQLEKHTITPKQYAAQSPKPDKWRVVIPQMRTAVRKFNAIKPVPPSMRTVNGGLMTFSSSMDKALTKLDRWNTTRKPADFKLAATELGGAYLSLMKAAQASREKMQRKPR